MTTRSLGYEPDLARYVAACLVIDEDGAMIVEDRHIDAQDEDDARHRLFKADRHGDIQEIVSVSHAEAL